jgi:FkbM family methyltransferase
MLFNLYIIYDRYFPIDRGKFFLSRMLYKITGPVRKKVRHGIWMEILPYSSMDMSYLSKNESHVVIENEINKLHEGDVFVDVGANAGYFSFLASRKVGQTGRVYSFEPSAREYLRLAHGKELNKAQNVVLFNSALSEKVDVLSFEINDYHTGLNHISQNGQASSHVELVLSLTLDMIIEKQKIDLLKIDVEGAELKVLKGCRGLLASKSIGKLIVEITPKFLESFGDSKSDLISYLESFGYRPVFQKDEWQYDEIFLPYVIH